MAHSLVDECGSRVHNGRRADGEEDVAGCLGDALRDYRRVDSLAKPDDTWPGRATTVRTAGRYIRKRYRVVTPVRGGCVALVPTAELPDRAVKANDVAGARALMQPVDVLGDECESIDPLAPGSQNVVTPVGSNTRYLLSSPVVPLPDQVRVTTKRLRGGQLLWPVPLPEAGGAAGRRWRPTRPLRSRR